MNFDEKLAQLKALREQDPAAYLNQVIAAQARRIWELLDLHETPPREADWVLIEHGEDIAHRETEAGR